jgi:hypothetical protein
MPSFWRECQMTTLCTAFPAFSREDYNLHHTLRTRAKTAVKINVQEVILLDELQPSWTRHLEFYAVSSRPPSSADSPEPLLRLSPATGHDAEMLEGEDPDLGYYAEKFPYKLPQREMEPTFRTGLLGGSNLVTNSLTLVRS